MFSRLKTLKNVFSFCRSEKTPSESTTPNSDESVSPGVSLTSPLYETFKTYQDDQVFEHLTLQLKYIQLQRTYEQTLQEQIGLLRQLNELTDQHRALQTDHLSLLQDHLQEVRTHTKTLHELKALRGF